VDHRSTSRLAHTVDIELPEHDRERGSTFARRRDPRANRGD
jgi:hypothetical protein